MTRRALLFLTLAVCFLGCDPQESEQPMDVSVQDDTSSSDTAPQADTTAQADTAQADTAQADTTPPGDVPVDTPSDTAQVLAPAVLVIADQNLESPYNSLLIAAAGLAEDATSAGTIEVYYRGGAQDGELMGSRSIAVDEALENAAMTLDVRVVGTQPALAHLLDATDRIVAEAEFTLVGDPEEPELFMADQILDSANLYGLVLSRAVVPERYAPNAWVAIYEDDGSGGLGRLRGKVSVQPGLHETVAFDLDNELSSSQKLIAVMREGRPGSGSWSSSSPRIANLSGQPVVSELFVDSELFRPLLEVEDQEIFTTTTGTSQLTIKKVTVPEAYIGGGWVAIYDDNAGSPGTVIGKLYYTRGTREDRVLDLDVNLAGENTLHAKLHAGQLWADAELEVMTDSTGNEVHVTFLTGAQELSYILAPPHTTADPRHVVVQRAYSFDKPAWIVLARDDGTGQPGVHLARKKVPLRFAGNVHLYDLYGNFLEAGTGAEYLTGQPDTFRRYVRGEETLHVLMFEDDPADGQFTYTQGGSEDVPVLDSNSQPVASMIDVTVASSIQNVQKDSPRFYWPCPLSQHIGNPTALPVDCRCHVNVVGLDFPECKGIIADSLNMQFGEGPRAKTHGFGHFRSGFTEPETSSLVGLMVWKDANTVWPENSTTIDVGAVVRFDVETRERTVIGGRYEDPNQGIIDVGTGPVLSYPFEVQKGPDGMYYIASYGYVRIGASLTPTVDIIKMDPATGNREYVWRSNHLGYNLDNQSNPYGHCANGRDAKYGYYSVQIGRKSFGIGPDGTFYLSYAHNGNTPTSDGIGILEVSADGGTCDFVTRTKVGADNVLYAGQSIGSGAEPQAGPYKGMLVKDGKLYVSTALDDDLWEIDIATGDRTVLHADGVDDSNSGSSGTHVVWDGYRDLIWQAGLSGSTLLYDPATDTSEPLWCPQNYRDYQGISCVRRGAWGSNGLPLERGLWLHPSDQDYMFVVNGAMIQRVHLPSGTSEIFSY